MEILGLIGHPVGHSFSKKLHTSVIKSLSLEYEYKLFDISPDKIQAALEGIRLFGFRGVNVTVPHKTAVIPFLDEITESARLCGAVNTIVNDKDRLIGYNTDFEGFKEALKYHAFEVKGKNILVLGAGGAARAVVSALKDMGTQAIYIANRTLASAQELSSLFSDTYAVKLSNKPLSDALNNVDGVINTTTLGMYPNIHTPSIISSHDLSNTSFVYDIVYNPAMTSLLKEAEKAGCRFANGLEMLVQQGAKSFHLWTGIEAPIDVMRKVLAEEDV